MNVFVVTFVQDERGGICDCVCIERSSVVA